VVSKDMVGTATGADATESRSEKAKRVVREEAIQFFGIFLYLAIVFGMFVLHEWVVLSAQHVNFRFYGLALINALVLAKILLVAQHLHFAEQFRGKPLAIPIAYKSVAFTILLFVAYVVEEILIGLFHGKTVAEGIPTIGDGTAKGWLVIALIMSLALVPFFAYIEIGRALGTSELRTLLFGRRAGR